MNTNEAMSLIEEKRQAALSDGVEPFAVLLDEEVYGLVYSRRDELNAETVIHDPLLQPEHGGVLWWSEREYEKAEEVWMDLHGY